MKFLKYAFGALFIVLIAGFAFFAMIDVPVDQQEIRLEVAPESLAQ
jgi:hypothetical protein